METKEGKQEIEEVSISRGATIEKPLPTYPQDEQITEARAFLIAKFTNFIEFLQEKIDDKPVFSALVPLFEKRSHLKLRIEQEVMIFCSGYCTIAKDSTYNTIIKKWETAWQEEVAKNDVVVEPLTEWFKQNAYDLDTLVSKITEIYPLASNLDLPKMKENLVFLASHKVGILKVFRLVRYLALWNSMLGGITLNG